MNTRATKTVNDKNSNLISDYEKVRLENIRRNEEFLKSLGLNEPVLKVDPNQIDFLNVKNSRKKRKADSDDYIPLPSSRRSSRISNGHSLDSSLKPSILTFPVRDDLLEKLQSLGHSGIPARKSLYFVNLENSDVDKLSDHDIILLCEEWLTSHANDAHFNDEDISISTKHKKKEFVMEKLEYVEDENETITRTSIKSAELRNFIQSISAEHSEKIPDAAISHCVHRINTMNSKKLTTRLKMMSRFVLYNKCIILFFNLCVLSLLFC